jgi:hypothetical protein
MVTINIKDLNGKIAGREEEGVIIKEESGQHEKSVKNIDNVNWDKIKITNF